MEQQQDAVGWAELRELAEAVQANGRTGRWKHCIWYNDEHVYCFDDPRDWILKTHAGLSNRDALDYICAADPPTILALLDRLEALEAGRQRVAEMTKADWDEAAAYALDRLGDLTTKTLAGVGVLIEYTRQAFPDSPERTMLLETMELLVARATVHDAAPLALLTPGSAPTSAPQQADSAT